MVYNCPVRLNVWYLTSEQWEELIEDLNTLKDIEVTQQLESTELEEFSKNTYKQNFVQSDW